MSIHIEWYVWINIDRLKKFKVPSFIFALNISRKSIFTILLSSDHHLKPSSTNEKSSDNPLFY